MKTDELREKYLAFFQTKGHTRKASDVLVPRWDPSVLFTPAGMNPFKDHFLGKVKLEFTRATTSQKCLRTGDIDNVGRTAFHHTFFEMLGNFSFGDYFKKEAIHWAWEFLTDKKWLGIPGDLLTVTVYLDDDEAADIWHNEIGLPTSRIERMGEDDNFWPASSPSKGPDGVCGPCSEIYYKLPSGKTVEIWNLVFTQFNRVGNPPNNLRPLPSKNIDTGMGLERIASVMQGVDTNYHIDILRPIVEAAAEVCSQKYDPASDNGRRLRRIADHVRACTFAIHENVLPGPNREKYVIRRLLRRAVLDGHQMGLRDPFLYQLVPIVAEMMKSPYPELGETIERVQKGIKAEESAFFGTIDAGLARISGMFDSMKSEGRVMVAGGEAADLYQTNGVPPELVENMAAELNFTFDWDGFRTAMEEHGERSGKIADVVFKTGPIEALKRALKETQFVGYETTETTAEIKGVVAAEHLVDTLEEVGHESPVIVVLDKSPFYGESGGQVGDTGEIVGPGFKFQVIDTQKDADLLLHYGHLIEGKMNAGAKVTAKVDTVRRNGIRRAHSATHILQYALQQTLGKETHQMGSKVEEDQLRFDFGNPSPVDAEQLLVIEKEVHARVAAADPVAWKFVPLTEARTAGAMMLFGEKYPDPARMVSMGSFSKELCAGTHLDNTRDVLAFEIIAEEGVAAGTRRIVALTGEKAKSFSEKTSTALNELANLLGVELLAVPQAVRTLAQQVRDLKKQLASGGKGSTTETSPPRGTVSMAPPSAAQIKAALKETARTLNVGPFDAPARAAAMLEEVTTLTKQIAERATTSTLSADSLIESATLIGDVKVIVSDAPGSNANILRQLIDQIRKKTSPVAILFAAAEADDKVVVVAGVSKELVDKGVSAGNWVKEVSPVVGGGGGGRPDLAQAGGKIPAMIPDALKKALEVIATQLAK
ncbi:alanyl-tRNA synthetase [Pirellula staleyi DSM 6068]|uniref:Alanine--tRNA ligase n=1 Tax=Pirellula staleyi (strain ATCC 27377 / DSM 6068 / ICPB 4128) TaxID=530564 RepID=D2R0Z2_PIRSD|nr:alanine--tRNA ligase [Pirellula staleyi]ADB18477.1 alanyl-tRNA synthetase [Pirellula staleyi DSM 6068]